MNIDAIYIIKYSDNSRSAHATIRSVANRDMHYDLYISIKEAKALIKAFKLQEEITHARGNEIRIYEPLKSF